MNTLKITSSAFNHKDKIPAKYTCDGENMNPPLSFEDVPKDAETLVLIMDDPDAPSSTFVHWLVWNISPKVENLNEGSLPPGKEGMTSSNTIGYIGPCPPSGTHRYFFKLYALDTKLDLSSKATKKDLESSIEKHIIDRAELIGLYR